MSRGLRLCCISAALHSSTASSRDNSNNKDKDDVDVVTLGALQPPLVGEARHSSSSSYSSGSGGAGWGRPGKASLGEAESPDETLARLLQHTFGSVLEAQHQEALEAGGELSNTLVPEEELLGATSTEERSEPDTLVLLEGLGESGPADMDGVERTVPAVGQVDTPRVGDDKLTDSDIAVSKQDEEEDEHEHEHEEVVAEAATSPGSGDGTVVVGDNGDGGGESADAAAVNNIEAGLTRELETSGVDPSALSLDDEAVSLCSVVSPEMRELGGAVGTASVDENTETPDDQPDEDEVAIAGSDDPVVCADGQSHDNDAPSPISDEEEMDLTASGTEASVTGTGVAAVPSSVVPSPGGVDGIAVGEERDARDESNAGAGGDRDELRNMAEALAEDPTGSSSSSSSSSSSASLEGRGTGGWVDQLEAPAGGVPLGGDGTRRDTTTRAQEQLLPAEKAVRGASVEEPLTRDVNNDVTGAGGAFDAAWKNAAAAVAEEQLEPREQQQKGVEPGAVSTATTAVVVDDGLEAASMRHSTDVGPPQEKPRRDNGGDVKEATTNNDAVPHAATGSPFTARERLTQGDGSKEGGRGEEPPWGEEQAPLPRKRPKFFFSEPAKNGGGTVGDVGGAPGGLTPGLSPDNATGFTMPPLPPIDLNDPTSTQGLDLGGDSQGDNTSGPEGWWDTWGHTWANVAKETGLHWARIVNAKGAALADAGLQMCRARAVKTWHEILEPRVERLRRRLEDAAWAAYDEVGEHVADPMLAEAL